MSNAKLTVIPFVGNGRNTSMFYATTVQLGPDGIADVPDPDSKRPYFGFARVGYGQTTGSHFHDGYSLLMFTEGGYEVGGETFSAGTVILIEPRVPTGECVPAKEGVTELYIYENGYGAIPFFKDLNDPRTKALFESYPPFKNVATSRPRPAEDPNAKVHTLDRGRHGRKGHGLTVYPCQIGPAGFGASPEPNGTRPFALLLEFDPRTAIPTHAHAGWNSLVVYEGEIDVSGTRVQKGNSAILEPGVAVALKAGSTGASILRFFDTEAAAIPRFQDAAASSSFPLI